MVEIERLQHLYERVLAGPIMSRWHWLTHNFTPGTEGSRFFTPLTLASLDTVDEVCPGYADSMLTRLEQMGGRDRSMDHYAQILQWLAELLVMRHLAAREWPTPVSFEMEPTAGSSRKNPETVITLEGVGKLGVEVKCPNLQSYGAQRLTAPWQLNSRGSLRPEALAGEVTLPRDNPVKDFLVSADAKFAGFRQASPDFRSVLIIVWDDYIQEAVSALLAPPSGLLTPNSFHRDGAGWPVSYPNVNAVILIRHQHQFVRGMANNPAVDAREHFLDYGTPEAFPPHAIIRNPAGRPMSAEWLEALGATPIESLRGAAEYSPSDVVLWTSTGE